MDGVALTLEDGSTVTWPYEEIRQTQGFYRGEEIRLEHGKEPPELLVLQDVGFLSAIHRVAPRKAGHLHNPVTRRRRRHLTVIACLCLFLFLAVQYMWGIPGFAAVLASHIPVSWEERMGRAILDSLAPHLDRCTHPQRVKLINAIAKRLSATDPDNSYDYSVTIVRSSIVNAFALPGGYIVVFQGLLEKTDTPEELAGVIAHEIQHIAQHHSTRRIIEEISTALMIAAVAGDASGLAAFGIEGARMMGSLQYSRSHEEEADVEGMKMFVAAGLDPNEMIRFYETVLASEPAGESKAWKYLSTHPPTSERIATLKRLSRQLPSRSVKLLPYLDWHSARRACE